MRARLAITIIGLASFSLASARPVLAASGCHGDFPSWLATVKQEALAQGISARAVDEGLDGLTPDPSVIRRDHGQGVFRQSFEQFSQRMVPPRLGRARSLEQRYAPIFQRIEAKYGVSPPILLAIWGLETDFGSTTGTFPMIRSIATLAYDCRRSDMFKAELFDALRMVQRGAASGSSRAAWAGEIGQTQFMPSTYLKSAVSLGGGGRARPQPQCRRRARLDGAFPPAARLAARRRLGPGRAELRRHTGMEQEPRLLSYHRLFRHPPRRHVRGRLQGRRRRRAGPAQDAPAPRRTAWISTRAVATAAAIQHHAGLA